MFKKIVVLGLAAAAIVVAVSQMGQDAEPEVAEIIAAPDAGRVVPRDVVEEVKALDTTPELKADIIEPSGAAEPLLPEPVRAVLQGTPLESGVSNKVIAAPEPPELIVPESYSVEDAAKYYLPAEQRSPGNLGGPPPLPDVSNAQNGTTQPMGIAPPVAPPPQ